MAYFLSKEGIVVEAFLSDELTEIKNKFPNLSFTPNIYYVFRNKVEIGYLGREKFEKIFTPITEERVGLTEKAKQEMLIELEKKQHKGDGWRDYMPEALHSNLAEEFNEAGRALNDFIQNPSKETAEALKTECAHVAICAAMLMDWTAGKELEMIWKEKEKDDSNI
jgi:hypothetical protein